MAPQASVDYAGRQIGTITFDQPNSLAARRVGGGFAIDLPITVALAWQGGATPRPLLTNIGASLSYQTPEGVVQHLGYGACQEFFEAAIPSSGHSSVLVWTGDLPTLALYERARADRPSRLRFDVHTELCHLVPVSANVAPTAPRVRTEPHRVFSSLEVDYPVHAWAGVLRELKVLDLVVIEVPLPATAPERLRAVWAEVGKARNAVAQGGEAGWTACVVHVRKALEAWDKIEDEKLWPAKPEERKALSKRARLARLRWSLHQAAHPAVHIDDGNESDVWTREEAKFMLSTLCSLLAMREP